jgi:hypothetical protein
MAYAYSHVRRNTQLRELGGFVYWLLTGRFASWAA